MTIPADDSEYTYTGNGSATAFDGPRTFEEDHISVYTTDSNGTTSQVTSGYSVSKVGPLYTACLVTFDSPPADGIGIDIRRTVPYVQNTSVRNQGVFHPEIHENTFDWIVMMIQQLVRNTFQLTLSGGKWVWNALGSRIINVGDPINDGDAANKGYVVDQVAAEEARAETAEHALQSNIDSNWQRTLRVPDSIYQIPYTASQRANQMLGFDSSGNPRVIVPESGSAADILIQLASMAGGEMIGLSQGGSVQDAINYVTPEMFGATGEADDTSALQLAFSSGYNIRSNHPNRVYTVKDTIYTGASSEMRTFDFSGAQIICDHVSEAFSVSDSDDSAPSNIRWANIRIKGSATRDSVYSDVASHNGFRFGDNCVADNLEAIGFCDCYTFAGANSTAGIIKMDDARDNALVMRGTACTVQMLIGGSSGGDFILMKGSYNSVKFACADEAGCPGGSPDHDYIASAAIAFGADMDDGELGNNNSVENFTSKKYGAAGVSMSGQYCNVGVADVGSSYYSEKNSQLTGTYSYALQIISAAQYNTIGRITAESCFGGVSIAGGDGNKISTIRISSMTGTDSGCLAFGTSAKVKSLDIGELSITDTNLWVGCSYLAGSNINIGKLNLLRVQFESLTSPAFVFLGGYKISVLNLSGKLASDVTEGVYIKLQSTDEIEEFNAWDIRGMALWINNTSSGCSPKRATLRTVVDATSHICQISAANFVVNNWRILGLSADYRVLVSGSTSNPAAATFIGCAGLSPYSYGDVTVVNSQSSNMWYTPSA